ncbi:S-adenosyl-L-methionine-dependent methyltransferase [Calycina marina]|uniref:S-adenosyl-L-methionine-dependent methyltransferase n=1 Tax=Calycina marina TaxID=1763456 RepID=A0A9P7ZAR4_9HELO|nr:S-adenosyl-L-methionine-dependent methyltransferase [Calycina marina]
MSADDQDWQTQGLPLDTDDNPDTTSAFDAKLEVDSIKSDSSGGPASTGHTIADPASVEDFGRTFHGYKDGKYFLPNDGPEQDRLDIQHKVFEVLYDGKLGFAPVQDARHVLDLATGTGLWALEYAEKNPNAQVIGTDLSLIQPRRATVPNCEFIREDSEDPWIFPHKFDYIHARAILSCFNDTAAVFQQAFDNLNEGGWIEIQDGLGFITGQDESFEGTALQRWSGLVIDGFAKLGRDLYKSLHYREWLEAAGFTDILELRIPVPCNSWPKDPKFKQVGKWLLLDLHHGMDGIGSKVLPAAGLTPEEIVLLTTQARKDLTNRSIHAFIQGLVICAKKPHL